MNKRRRAYKKYDWQSHSLDLIGKMLDHKIKEFTCMAFDIALLYGRENLFLDAGHKETFKAGIWSITVPLPKPYKRDEKRETETREAECKLWIEAV